MRIELARARALALMLAEGAADFVARAHSRVSGDSLVSLEKAQNNLTDLACVMGELWDCTIPVVLPSSPLVIAQELSKALDIVAADPDAEASHIATLGKAATDGWLSALDEVLTAILDGSAPPASTGEFPSITFKTARIEKREGEERFVMGVVLEPETTDSQGDIYDELEVRNAAHKFMEKFANVGLQHTALVNDEVRILESFIARQPERFGEQVVKAGTWLMGVRVQSDRLWKAVKDGDLTGFSIGGTATKRPLKSLTT